MRRAKASTFWAGTFAAARNGRDRRAFKSCGINCDRLRGAPTGSAYAISSRRLIPSCGAGMATSEQASLRAYTTRIDGCGDAFGQCCGSGRSGPASGTVKLIVNGGPTDGLRRRGCLVWNMAPALMVSLAEKPLTGEPDAGNPPVRFGGRGGANTAIPTSINL